MSSAFCKIAHLVSYPRLQEIRFSSQLTAARILNESNLNRCIECIRKTAPIQMQYGKSELEAAVLVPICVDDKGEVSLLYTRRSAKLSRHVRQVSFPDLAKLMAATRLLPTNRHLYGQNRIRPTSSVLLYYFEGGLKDDTDMSFEDCALRETEEEIGLPRSRVKVVGTGVLLRPPRAAAIMPVFGIIENLNIAELKINADEVDEAFTLPFAKLSVKECRFHTQFREGFSAPVFKVDEYKIWGITGAITHNFLSCLLQDAYDKNLPHVKRYKKV